MNHQCHCHGKCGDNCKCSSSIKHESLDKKGGEESMMMKMSRSTAKIDKLGIFLSGACAVHCLLVPLILPFLVVSHLTFFASEGFEFWSWTIAFGLCLVVTVYQYAFKHKHASVFIPLALCFGLIMNKGMFGASAASYVAFAAGLLLVLTHILNLKMCKLCPKCQSQDQ